MRHTSRTICLLLAFFVLGASCDAPELHDGYQFGDISRIGAREINVLIETRERACAYAEDNDMRKALHRAALVLIRSVQPAYPANGVCDERFDQLIAQIRAIRETP